MPVHIVRQDITKMKVDAIVNAANSSLLGGGGVDGAIHRAAGPKLLEECRQLHGCDTGDAKITGAGKLPCRKVIHTVGPIWRGGGHGEEGLLRSCYERSLTLAQQNGLKSVAFPLISSGAYGYPKDQALRVAGDTIRAFLDRSDSEMDVYIVVFDRASFRIGAERFHDIEQYIDDRYTAPAERAAELSLDMRAPSQFRDLGRLEAAGPPKTKKRTEGREEQRLPRPLAAAGLAPGLDELIDRLEAETFSDRVLRLIGEAGMTDAECYKRANLDRRHFSKIRNNPHYSPSKGTALALALALHLSLDDTKSLLESAGYALTHSSRADIIVEYCINHGTYDVMQVNEALFAFDQPLLTS